MSLFNIIDFTRLNNEYISKTIKNKDGNDKGGSGGGNKDGGGNKKGGGSNKDGGGNKDGCGGDKGCGGNKDGGDK
jgi:hypothetical protein